MNVTDSLSHRLTMRNTHWEIPFEQNRLLFSQKITERIAQEVFSKLRNTLEDPYRESPTERKPITWYFSFEITKAKSASSLKEMAQETRAF